MAWSPPALNAGIVWVSTPGDYATFNSNHTPDGTPDHGPTPQNQTPEQLHESGDKGDVLVLRRSELLRRRQGDSHREGPRLQGSGRHGACRLDGCKDRRRISDCVTA